MKPFFVYTHLGVNIPFWEKVLSSHRRIMSNFDPTVKSMYYNGDLTERVPEPKKWFFSKAKYFDILLYNDQVGFKNFYSLYPSVLIYSFGRDVLDGIKDKKLYNRKYAETYLSMRYKRLNYICGIANKPLVFVEGLSSVSDIQQSLSDFLNIKNECAKIEEDLEPKLGSQDTNLLYLKRLHEMGKITLAI